MKSTIIRTIVVVVAFLLIMTFRTGVEELLVVPPPPPSPLPPPPSIHLGRGVGNLIFLYSWSILEAMHYGRNVPTPHSLIQDMFPEANLSYRFAVKELPTREGLWREYPHLVAFYLPHRDHFRRFYNPRPLEKRKWAVHVRLDDIGNDHKFYTPLPGSFYRNITPKEEGVRLVYRPPHDEFTKRVLEVVRLSMNVTAETYGGEKEAFYTILSSTHVVLSTSSFSFWAIFLSPFLEKALAPKFGVMLKNEQAGGLGLEDWPLVTLVGEKLTKIGTIKELN
jgi:hypothetical protein